MKSALLVVVLVACDQRGVRLVKQADNQVCTPLMPKWYLDHLRYVTNPILYPRPKGERQVTAADAYMDGAGTWSEIAADCVITKARLYSDKRDEASSVAVAVLEACRSDLETLEAHVYEDAEHRDGFEFANSAVSDLKEAERKAALHYIVEARSGNCTLDRINGVPVPSGFPTIQQ